MCHSFTHPPIVPFFSFPKKVPFHIIRIPPFIPHKPPCFPSLHFSFFSPPQIPSVLCSTPPLTSPSFSAPVEYYRMFSSIPPALSSSVPFLSKISSWYPSFIPPFPFLLSYTHFFPSLHTHPSSLDSNFTVIYGNPSSKSSSQHQSLSLFPSPSYTPPTPPPPAVPLPLVSFPLLLIS